MRRGNVSRLAPLLLPVPRACPWPPIGRGWSRDLSTGLLLADKLPRPGRSECKLTQVCSAFRQITTGAGAGGESLDQLRTKRASCGPEQLYFDWGHFNKICIKEGA